METVAKSSNCELKKENFSRKEAYKWSLDMIKSLPDFSAFP